MVSEIRRDDRNPVARGSSHWPGQQHLELQRTPATFDSPGHHLGFEHGGFRRMLSIVAGVFLARAKLNALTSDDRVSKARGASALGTGDVFH
jgi:hypothetical protein